MRRVAQAHARHVRARAAVGRRARHAGRRAQRPAARRRHRRGRVLRRLRHPGDPARTRATSSSSATRRWPSSRRPAWRSRASTARPLDQTPQRVPWDPIQAEKAGYKHFMLKEIFEQPAAVRDTMLGRVSLETGRVFLDEINLTDERARAPSRRSRSLACGTSWHAGLVGQVPDRGAGAAAGRGGLRVRVPLPQPGRSTSGRSRWSSRSRARPPTRWPRCARRSARARAASPSATSSAAWRRARPTARSTRTPGPRSAWPRPRRSPRSSSRSTCWR